LRHEALDKILLNVDKLTYRGVRKANTNKKYNELLRDTGISLHFATPAYYITKTMCLLGTPCVSQQQTQAYHPICPNTTKPQNWCRNNKVQMCTNLFLILGFVKDTFNICI
jgi:hypothetical protein